MDSVRIGSKNDIHPRQIEPRAANPPKAIGAAVLLIAAAFSGAAAGVEKLDPYESLNRRVFQFNEKLDEHLIAPISRGYQSVLPRPIRTGIGNFFSNTSDLLSAGYFLLQGQPQNSASELARFTLNTTVGVLGTFDVAGSMGFVRQKETMSSTLGAWGVSRGAYIVLPVFGPSTLRDSVDLPIGFYTAPQTWVGSQSLQNSLTALQLVEARAALLGATTVIDTIALDKYLFVRDAYLQRNHGAHEVEASPPESDQGK